MQRARALALAVVISCGALRVEAQEKRPAWPLSIDPAGATTGSRDEESLLLLQLTGRAPLIHTTIRSFSARALDTLLSWEYRGAVGSQPGISWMRPVVATWFNSGSPAETNGVVWAGRGFTGAIGFGAFARVGPLSVAIRPEAFLTENRAFSPPGGGNPFAATPPYQNLIDLPRRFGGGTYARIDPGESWIQADTRWIAAGLSTATQAWGPMHVFPLLLGPGAGGFPHLFAGTGLPWNVGIGRISGRMAVGRLDPSAFAPVHPGDRRRIASEIVGVFSPRGAEGFEIGAGRFFHRRWPSNGLTLGVLRLPLEGFLKDALPDESADAVSDNQLASAFFRLSVPRVGIEVYGEFLRDDHSYDIGDLIGEPDHESAYAMGLRRAWGASTANEALSTLTFEVVNGRITSLVRLREQTAMYTHTDVVEGHTQRGKLLASQAAFGGSGYSVAWTRDHDDRGWAAEVRSERVAQDAEAGRLGASHVGFHIIQASRRSVFPWGEITSGASLRLGWNARSGANSIGLFGGFRPIVRKTP